MLDDLARADPEALVAAIERAAAQLARGDAGDDVANAVAAHATHARAKVRQAVAEAAGALPNAVFETIIAPLLKDPNRFVKLAAKRAYDDRARRARTERDVEERSADVLRLRAQIQKAHGAGARRDADRLADAVLSQFTGKLLHELVKVATPLGGKLREIRAEAHRAGGDRVKIAAHADDAVRMHEILVAIAKSTRGQAQIAAPSFRDEDVRALVEEQLGLLRGRIGDRVARLRVTNDVGDGVVAEIDRGLFGQAVANVLENGVEAHGADGDIVIRVTAKLVSAGAKVAVAFEDRGRGIDAESLPEIGGAFVSSKGAGRGLGVLNVRRMVESVHGGDVEIESKVGVGTTVRLVVPRKQPRGG